MNQKHWKNKPTRKQIENYLNYIDTDSNKKSATIDISVKQKLNALYGGNKNGK